jgi:FkbM family methyltransferase
LAAYKAVSLQHRLFRGLLKMFERTVSAVSRDAYMKMAVEIVEELGRVAEVRTPEGVVKFHCDSEVARIRANGMLIREPDTLDWIRTFSPGDVFLDIGSNVGVFSLFAAVAREATVIACDPLPHNNYAITRNAILNGVSEHIIPLAVALTDVPGTAALSVPGVADATGGAGATYGETYDNYQNTIDATYKLTVPGISVDRMIEVYGLPVPAHIKMDIDGIQEKVIKGAEKTLSDSRLKSVMIELQPTNIEQNASACDIIRTAMERAGFSLAKTVRTSPNGSDDPAVSPTNNFFYRS